ncbi:MAG: GHKL domain-containing protein [Clostridiales bacterium]|nr:GHKL domain-containing protein [Clostridiales bacterium]
MINYFKVIIIQIMEMVLIFYTMSLILKTSPALKSLWRTGLSVIIFFSSFLLVNILGKYSEGAIGLVVQIISVNLLFKVKVMKRNITYVAVYCIISFIAMIIYVCLSRFFNVSFNVVSDGLIGRTLTYIIILIIVSIINYFISMNYKVSNLLSNTSFTDILLISLVSVLWVVGIACSTFSKEEIVSPKLERVMVVSMNLLLWISIVVVTGYLWKSIISKFYKKENLMKEELIALREEYYKKLIDNSNDIKKFKHDIRAHMICLKELASSEKYDEMKQYLDQMEHHVEALCNRYNVGNEITNIILNGFYEEVTNNHIDFTCEGKFRGNVIISSYDLCTLFYNIVKNAIEACIHVDEGKRKINLEIKSIKDNLLIVISNSISEPVDINMIERNGTTKKDKGNHGYGILNIKRVVQKYNGVMNCKNSMDMFTVEILLHNVYET